MPEFDEEDMNLVDELPSGTTWMVAAYGDMLIFTSPSFAPRVLKDGEMTRLNPVLVPMHGEG